MPSPTQTRTSTTTPGGAARPMLWEMSAVQFAVRADGPNSPAKPTPKASWSVLVIDLVGPTSAIGCGTRWRGTCASTTRDNADRQLDRQVRSPPDSSPCLGFKLWSCWLRNSIGPRSDRFPWVPKSRDRLSRLLELLIEKAAPGCRHEHEVWEPRSAWFTCLAWNNWLRSRNVQTRSNRLAPCPLCFPRFDELNRGTTIAIVPIDRGPRRNRGTDNPPALPASGKIRSGLARRFWLAAVNHR